MMYQTSNLSKIMKTSALGMSLIIASASTVKAEPVISFSKRNIAIAVFQGKCDSSIEYIKNYRSALKEAKKKQAEAVKKAGDDKKAIEQANEDFSIDEFAARMYTQQGCSRTGLRILKPNENMIVSAGQWIVAAKMSGNPKPAICKIPVGKVVALKTIKSEGLRSLVGISGDGGLQCVIK